MKPFRGKALSWHMADGVVELVLDREPCNEIGSATLTELEQFVSESEPMLGNRPRVDYFQQPQGRLLRRGRSSRALRALTEVGAGCDAPPASATSSKEFIA